VYEQLLDVQRALLAVLLPWTAVRCAAAARGNELVILAAAAAARPSRVLLGQCAGRFAALAAIVMVGLPPAIVARQASALPLGRVASDLLPLLGLCAAASVASTWSMLACRSRVAAWVWSSVLVLVLAWAAGPWLASAASVVGAGALGLLADTRFRYLSDEVLPA
jgi:hypothetical protein